MAWEALARGARSIEIGSAGYPAGLLDLRDPPRVLYVKGWLPEGGIAIVGSRRPPARAAKFAFELARRVGEPVVSGLALGIDAAAHRGAIAAKIPTLAYVGYGFGRTYPPHHAALEQAIVETGGGVATERPPGEPVAKWALVKRDRLQAAHARAVLLVASEAGGGAMHTLRFARELGRAIFAIVPPDGAQARPQWEGNLRALALGARPLPLGDLDEAVRTIA